LTREIQLSLALTLLAPLAAGALGLLGLGVPIAVSGAGLLALAVVLLLVMPEGPFQRTPAAERETIRHLARQVRKGMQVARRRPVVRTIALVSLIVGLANEAVDRLWTVRVLASFTLLDIGGLDGQVVGFTAIALAGTLVCLVVSLIVDRVAPRLVGAEHPNWLLASLVGLQVLFVVAVALGGSLWLVLGALWGRSAAGAVGQVVGGPPLGVVSSRRSTSTARTLREIRLLSGVGLRRCSRFGILVLGPPSWGLAVRVAVPHPGAGGGLPRTLVGVVAYWSRTQVSHADRVTRHPSPRLSWPAGMAPERWPAPRRGRGICKIRHRPRVVSESSAARARGTPGGSAAKTSPPIGQPSKCVSQHYWGSRC
jgi:hypothetical protein